ncbi:anaphase-promoting complex subunit 5-like isoform X1 [Phaseolus vulgaris]|uniref:anaphase-promoting complex subunit 5-like isoform X1 n=1 Tax=Phaseolus vulgaris TaxID=3885 RepID=UPI0035CC08F1
MGTLQVIFCEMLIRVVQYFCEQTGRYKGTYRSKLILLKKNGNAVSYNGLEIILQQLQKLAPELHRHVQRPLLSFGPKTSMKLSTCPVNVCKEIRLSSQLISDFSYESSAMTIDGAFSTAWLMNLQKPTGSPVFCQEIGSRSSSNVSQFIAQPTSIPGSVLSRD